jgi:hypothetical protein
MTILSIRRRICADFRCNTFFRRALMGRRNQETSFHIHVDATVLPETVHKDLRGIGFVDTNFSGHPEGYQHFEPNTHMTLKTSDLRSYRAVWHKAARLVTATEGFKGYLEGELVRPFLSFKPRETMYESRYKDADSNYFLIRRRRLKGAASGEAFRKNEVHLTLDKDRSDPRLISDLLAAGMYGAYVPKDGYTALVLTAQSTLRPREFNHFVSMLKLHVMYIGGVVCGRLKEEIAIDHLLVGVGPEELPEVIDEIIY